MLSAAAWTDTIKALMPRGRAWGGSGGLEPDSVMTRFCAALAEEFARLAGRAEDLKREYSPFMALELLPEWEALAGLPDPCLPVTGTTAERQLRVGRKVTSTGGQSRAFFIELAAQMGLVIEIDEFTPFVAGTRCGLPLYSNEWRVVWRVRLLPFSESTGILIRESRFRSGLSRAGDRLRSFSVSELECIIRRAAPAHSHVIFVYPIDPDPIFDFDFLSNQGAY